MQGFQTSATTQAPITEDAKNIDYFFLPQMPMEEAASTFNIRVPILPHTDVPHHTARAPEVLDTAIAPPQISVVSHHPEINIASAMTEVVDNAGEEKDIQEAQPRERGELEGLR